MPILFEISYINPLMCEPLYVIVTLSELGFPRNGWHTSPVKSDFALVLTVGRVGLMARFVRTFVILHTSSSARLSRTFHPKFWFRRLKHPPHDEGGEEQQFSGSQRPQGSSSKWGESSRRGLEWVAFIVNFMIWDIVGSLFFRSHSDTDRRLEPCEESEQDQVDRNRVSLVRDIVLKRKIKRPNFLGKPNSITESIFLNAAHSHSHVG